MELVIQPRAITSSRIHCSCRVAVTVSCASNRSRTTKEKRSDDERTVHHQSSNLDIFSISSCLVVGAALPTTRHPRCGGVMQDKGIGSLLVSV